MKLRRSNASGDVRLELTPLIDVVFLLLTFFIFSMILLIRADLLDVRLPTLGSAQTANPGPGITVAIRADGSIAVDGEPVEDSAMIEAIRSKRESNPEARLLLAVDSASPAGSLLGVADRLVAAGLGEFSLLAMPSQTDRGETGSGGAGPASVDAPAAVGPPP